MAEKQYFNAGMVVKCTTAHDETIQGEVVAFDKDFKLLVLKSTSLNGKSENSDIKLVNLGYVKNLETIKDAPISSATSMTTLPTLNYIKLAARRRMNTEEKMKKLNYIGTGVSPTAQKLFDTILKTIPEIQWQGNNILIMKSVIIVPPYQAENCQSTDSEIYQNGQESLKHVRKIVTKFHEDHKETVYTSSSSSSTSPALA